MYSIQFQSFLMYILKQSWKAMAIKHLLISDHS